MDYFALAILDAVACALLAAAASCRARNLGAQFSGAATLGFCVGLSAPMLREGILHGTSGMAMVLSFLPGMAFAGAIAGVFLSSLPSPQQNFIRLKRGLFFWLDSTSIGLTCALALLCALPETVLLAALSLGLIIGLAPGLLRDMALGDSAQFVEQPWYAASAFLGCFCTLVLALACVSWALPLWRECGIISALCGMGFSVAVRYWKGEI